MTTDLFHYFSFPFSLFIGNKRDQKSLRIIRVGLVLTPHTLIPCLSVFLSLWDHSLQLHTGSDMASPISQSISLRRTNLPREGRWDLHDSITLLPWTCEVMHLGLTSRGNSWITMMVSKCFSFLFFYLASQCVCEVWGFATLYMGCWLDTYTYMLWLPSSSKTILHSLLLTTSMLLVTFFIYYCDMLILMIWINDQFIILIN